MKNTGSQSVYYPWLCYNANQAWGYQNSQGLTWDDWITPTVFGGQYAWDCCPAVSALQQVVPLYTVYHDFYNIGEYSYAMFQPNGGNWWVMDSAMGGTNTFQWGTSGDIPLVGNSARSSDGSADVCVWRPSTGTFWVRNSDGGNFTVQWGISGDIPFLADFYDHGGKSDYCVYRSSTTTWWVTNSMAPGNNHFVFGQAGDIPLVGYLEAGTNNSADAVMWRLDASGNGWFYVRQNGNGNEYSVQWGTNGDIPLLGSFYGDGKDDFVIFRPSTGDWHILNSQNTTQTFSFNYGATGDIPMTGRVTPDSEDDAIIYRPSNNGWYVWDTYLGEQLTSFTWGNSAVNPVK